MARFKLALLYTLCAPWDATLILVTCLLRPLGVAGTRVHRGVLWLDVRQASWLHCNWRWSTTLGHVVLLQPDLAGTDVEAHELVHVRQYEGAVLSVWLMAFVISTTSLAFQSWFALLAALSVAPWSSYAGASLAAVLRSQRPYLDNHFERHARADAPAFRSEPARPAPKG